ncbi:hypothetical protein ACLI07_23440 (plasmid) [Providencia huaxiensis]|nr:hypothetical protein [Providencia rustigianii]URR25532.1 hypothetical protein L3Q80_23610 [Providencia rettgeri]HAZ7870778.1 hypothetical protein [Escherichia coli]HAZ7966501.1 hypothetical protein [Escherichia coli]HAZ7972094.1 hypothetical protein [Escherichia coli]HBC3733823.1 hypothetical protein [Escherichia coli]
MPILPLFSTSFAPLMLFFATGLLAAEGSFFTPLPVAVDSALVLLLLLALFLLLELLLGEDEGLL